MSIPYNKAYYLVALPACILATMALAKAQAKPDLRVTELTVEKVNTMNVPLRINVTVAIKNFGATTSAGFTTRLSYKTSSSAPYSPLYDFHSAVRQTNGGDRWERNFDFQEGGTYYFKAEADADKAISESLEGNNTKLLTKTFVGGTPDLVVSNLTAQFTSVRPSGATAKVEWDVENTGDGKAVGTFVTVLKVSKNGGSYAELARFTRSSLNQGASAHFYRSVTYADVHSLRFMVIVDDTHTIHERLEGNNTAYTQTIKP